MKFTKNTKRSDGDLTKTLVKLNFI